MALVSAFEVLELLERRKKPVRLEKPLAPLGPPPENAPPPALLAVEGAGPEVCRVGYSLAAGDGDERQKKILNMSG